MTHQVIDIRFLHGLCPLLLVISCSEVVAAQDAEVDGPPVREVAYGVDDLAHADLLKVLPVQQHLLAARIDIDHGCVIGPYQRGNCA